MNILLIILSFAIINILIYLFFIIKLNSPPNTNSCDKNKLNFYDNTLPYPFIYNTYYREPITRWAMQKSSCYSCEY